MNDTTAKDPEKLIGELEESKKKLEDVNHFKNHLLTLASHQFKSPLASIKGYVQLLLDGSYGEIPEKAKTVLRKVEFSADELVRTVESVIDLRKIEEGRIEYKKDEVDIVALVAETCGMFSHMAGLKGLDFRVKLPDRAIFVVGDAQHLKHVVQNLLDNAFKYTPKGFIEVSAGESGNNVIVSVKDSGIGIKPGVAPTLFEEFVRGEEIQEIIKGSGIGLHVVKITVEAHGGRVFAESEGEGKGSVFGFSLPRSQAEK